MSRWFVGMPVLALLVGASSLAAPVPTHLKPKEPPLYYPTRVGAKWVYLTGEKTVFGDTELTQSVTAVKKTKAGLLVTVTTVADHGLNGRMSRDHQVLVTPAGLGYVDGSRGEQASPRWVLKLPCVVREKWEVDVLSKDFMHEVSWTTLGSEVVEVPAGKFTAVKVREIAWWRRSEESLDVINHRTLRSVVWYAPGIGVVKREDESPIFPPMVLKSFTP